MVRQRIQGVLWVVTAMIFAGCVSEEPAPEPVHSQAGKGDRIVTVDECTAFIANYDPNPCGEFDIVTATLEETEENIACLEDVVANDITVECCGLSEFENSQFCGDAIERGYATLCEAKVTDFERCILQSDKFGGSCHEAFVTVSTDEPLSCCDRVDTWACDRALPDTTIPDQESLAELFRQERGYFWQSPAFERMYPVDILPENLQNSLAIHQDPYRNDRLDPTLPSDQQLQLHEIVERIPVQYGVQGYLGGNLVMAHAYVTLWRTANDDVAIIVHAFNPNTVATSSNYGWQDVTWGILEEEPCDVMTDAQLAAPGLAEISFALDFANGHPNRSCLSHVFEDIPADAPDVERPIAELLFNLGYLVGEDSRISDTARVWRIRTANFTGFLVEASEVITAEDVERFGPDTAPAHGRFLLDHRGDPIRVYDDQACERGPIYVNRARCFGGTR